MNSPLLTLTEVSTWLQIPEGTLRFWMHQRKIPFKKIVGQVRFDRAELEEWLESKSVKVHWARVKERIA